MKDDDTITIEVNENMRNMANAIHLVPEESAGQKLMTVLFLLPSRVRDFITKNYVFISRNPNREAATHFSFKEVWFKNKKGFILIDAGLWEKDNTEIALTIAHEVAHAFLGHGVKSFGTDLSSKEEKQADRTAVKWLSKHHKKEDLMKLCVYLGSD